MLENSQSEKVTLQKELETLRTYIELEAMRFKSKVRYEIAIAPNIDQQYTDIPPLLLHPYVENAIWHGLMHKKEGGNIKIDIAQPSEHLLHIEITDNGVGRELAAAYKSKSATRQKSFGLKMTSERIDIINQLYEMKADVKITDLKDAKNNAAGIIFWRALPLYINELEQSNFNRLPKRLPIYFVLTCTCLMSFKERKINVHKYTT